MDVAQKATEQHRAPCGQRECGGPSLRMGGLRIARGAVQRGETAVRVVVDVDEAGPVREALQGVRLDGQLVGRAVWRHPNGSCLNAFSMCPTARSGMTI